MVAILDNKAQPGLCLPFPDLDFPSWDFPGFIFEPEPIWSDPISSESNHNSPNSVESNHGSIHEPATEPAELMLEINERKLKRMKSNRESARRSRMRKQKHLDNLRNEAHRLSLTNQELSKRLRFVQHIGLTIRSENQRLRTEHSLLRQRLIELQNVLIFRQIQQMSNHKNNNVGGLGNTMMNEPMGI